MTAVYRPAVLNSSATRSLCDQQDSLIASASSYASHTSLPQDSLMDSARAQNVPLSPSHKTHWWRLSALKVPRTLSLPHRTGMYLRTLLTLKVSLYLSPSHKTHWWPPLALKGLHTLSPSHKTH